MILVYARSTNPADFSTDYKTLFPGRNIMPVNGHVVKDGDTYVYFLDYTEKPAFVFMKQLSEFTDLVKKNGSFFTYVFISSFIFLKLNLFLERCMLENLL